MARVAPFMSATLLAACHPTSQSSSTPPIGVQAPDDHRPWAGIGEGEVLHVTGTEPFWGGQVAKGTLTWTTPENQAGTAIAVTRFAGRNGLGLSGTLAGQPFEMAVSEAQCSDGMSDRSYPFTVTVRTAGKTLRGCGWTDAHLAENPGR